MTENLTGVLLVALKLVTLSLGGAQTLPARCWQEAGNQLLVDLSQLTVWAYSLVH